MRVLVAGSTAQNAAAIGLMISRHWPGGQAVVLARTPDAGLPAQNDEQRSCECCLLDLAGIGMSAPGPGNEARLQAFLAGRSAILLLPPGSTGWTGVVLATTPAQVLIRLPATSRLPDVGNALYQLRIALDRTQTACRTATTAPDPAHGSGVTSAQVPTRGSDGLPTVFAYQGETQQIRIPRLSRFSDNLAAALQVFPDLATHPLFRFFQQAVAAGGCLRLLLPGQQGALVICLQDGWLASRMTAFALRAIVLNGDVLATTQVERIALGEVSTALEKAFEGRTFLFHPMDQLLWDVLREGALRSLPARRGDLALRIVRFPNFNHLRNVDARDLQLAALCAHSPMSIAQLERRFGEASARRFVITALLSGHVELTDGTPQRAAAAAGVSHAGAVVPDAGMAARAGFFRSLLKRLF